MEKKVLNDEQRKKRAMRKKKAQRKQYIRLGIMLFALVVLISGSVALITTQIASKKAKVKVAEEKKEAKKEKKEKEKIDKEEKKEEEANLIKKADALAAGYDYDAAIKLLQEDKNFPNEPEMQKAVEGYTAEKAKCVRYESVETITHIFFHSLIVDSGRAFDGDDKQDGYNQVMTTVDEFNKIMEQMYAKGYVLISIYDMVKTTTDENGNTVFTEGDIYLPPGKIPFVLSQDDVSYYEYMDGDGFASKIILEEDGRPTCEYKQADGTVVTGDYDMVPLLETFIEKNPDFSYRGARGILAVTGYNGVFGYRTDPDYSSNPTYQKDIEDAKRVSQGLKDWGWDISSHSYGHRSYKDIDMESFKKDVDKWESTVENIVGSTDILIFPFGADVGSWRGYEGERYEYLKSVGFNYFCNVDSNKYYVQITDNYMRQGRRNLDGVRMYYDMIDDSKDMLSDLFDVNTVFDPARPTPIPQM